MNFVPLVSINLVTFSSPQGDYLATGDNSGMVQLWNLDGSRRGQPLTQDEPQVFSVAFSPAGDILASAYTGSGLRALPETPASVRLWNMDGSPRGEPIRSDSQVMSVAYSPRGDVVAFGGNTRTVQLRSVSSYFGSPSDSALGRPIDSHHHYVYSIAFSPDGGAAAWSPDEVIAHHS